MGNTFGQAGQPATRLENGRVGGTVYTSFIDITDNRFFLSYKLSNENVIKLDLNSEFVKSNAVFPVVSSVIKCIPLFFNNINLELNFSIRQFIK